MEKPIVEIIFTDNGEISHYELIKTESGEVLWSSFPEETIAMNRKILNNKEKILKQLNIWIQQCEEHAEIFNKNKMDTAEISSQAMEQAYWNAKQLIDVNYL